MRRGLQGWREAGTGSTPSWGTAPSQHFSVSTKPENLVFKGFSWWFYHGDTIDSITGHW